MKSPVWIRCTLILHILMIACCSAFAGENLYRQARELQREGKFDEAIETYKAYFEYILNTPINIVLSNEHLKQKEQVKNKPIYPEKGSIQMIDDIIYIKLN